MMTTRAQSLGEPQPASAERATGRFSTPARPFVVPARRRRDPAGGPASAAERGRLGPLLDGVRVHAGRPAARSAASAPIQRVQIPAKERAKPEEFMAARAHLAAALTGATVGQLDTEVDDSRQTVNRWQSTQSSPLSKSTAGKIRQQTLQRDYTTLHRFQNQPDHNQPRQDADLSGFQQVRKIHGDEFLEGNDVEKPYHPEYAFEGARHTKGENDSSFVSLVEDPLKLTQSKDDGEKGARTIAEKAKQLHRYSVPRQFTWDPGRLSRSMEKEFRDDETSTGETYGEWLGSTPTQEGEVLYLGGDLDKYRTGKQTNPYLRTSKKNRRKK